MSRDTEAEARVTQIWPSLKGQRKKKKKGVALSQSTFFFFAMAASHAAHVVFRQSAYTCRSNYRPLRTAQKYFRGRGWREDLARAINSAAFNLIYPLMPENLSGNARAFSLIVARISRRFARFQPHPFSRDEDSTGSFFRNFSDPIDADIDREWDEKIWIFGISRDSMGFFFFCKFFWPDRYRYRARMGLKIIWIFGVSGEARGFR